MELETTVAKMREYFLAGGMREASKRIARLNQLKAEIRVRENEICEALEADFNKAPFDTFTTEIGVVYGEINAALKHLKRWMKPRKVRVSLSNFPAKGRIYAEGYGVALIIAPWNYPFQLALAPLVGAVAAGNCAVIKPASKTQHTALVIEKIVKAVFDPEEAVVVRGTRESVNVLDVKFDYIFFTGGKAAGRKVMEAAARYLTPVSLELGGKSPCIVDRDADVARAARRVAWAKYVNAGQTCVAPDYLLLHADVYDAFLEALKAAVYDFYYEGNLLRYTFAYVSDERKAAWCADVLSRAKVLMGGDVEGRMVAPTAVAADWDDELMADEIFAPILPVIRFTDTDEIIAKINARPRPLAFYYFGEKGKSLVERVPFGGGCINDAVMHVAEHNLPFGGVGESGMGMYHGKHSFDTFTHYKSVLIKGKTEFDVKYPPYDDKKLRFVQRILR